MLSQLCEQEYTPQHLPPQSSCLGTYTPAPLAAALPVGHGPAAAPSANDLRRAHLTKFAFLLSTARGEGADEPVVGMHHDVEMAACFSKRHLAKSDPYGVGGCGGAVMPVTPPSISSSSLSIGGGMRATTEGVMAMVRGASSQPSCRRAAMLEAAATSMGTPFYTTPDTVSSTAKIILKNIVTTIEELIDSRLRSTISQLVNKAGGRGNSSLTFRLLSPSRKPIRVATVITRFMLPEAGEKNMAKGLCGVAPGSSDNLLSIPLSFKAVVDIKVFGEVSTIELCTPVTMSSRFDAQDGLLTAVDASFDCVALLKTMIVQARSIVKLAVTKGATLSMQIANWHKSQKKSEGMSAASLMHAKAASAHSLNSFLGSTLSLNSLGTGSLGTQRTLSSLFTNLPSQTNNPKQKSLSRGVILNGQLSKLNSPSCSNNANATFDLGDHNTNSVVRFRMPGNSTPALHSPDLNKANDKLLNNPPQSCLATSSYALPKTAAIEGSPDLITQNNSFSNNPPRSCQAMTSYALPKIELPEAPQAPQPSQQQLALQVKQEQSSFHSPEGNIHKGLFSWLKDDDMFLTDEKIREQNAADAEREREAREAPMPLRFFTASPCEGGAEAVSRSIFGGGVALENGGDFGGGGKRGQQSSEGYHQAKRAKMGGWL